MHTLQTQNSEAASSLPHPTAADSHHLALALRNSAAGIPVFPCAAAGPRAKQPLVPKGHHAATTDPATIRGWWARWPYALVGIPTGPSSGLWVLDVDGELGLRSLSALLAKLGIASLAALTGCISRTPSGGLHLIFALQPGERPATRARDIGPGLDTRGCRSDGADGGYFISPGSVLPDGRAYALIAAADVDLSGDAE